MPQKKLLRVGQIPCLCVSTARQHGMKSTLLRGEAHHRGSSLPDSPDRDRRGARTVNPSTLSPAKPRLLIVVLLMVSWARFGVPGALDVPALMSMLKSPTAPKKRMVRLAAPSRSPTPPSTTVMDGPPVSAMVSEKVACAGGGNPRNTAPSSSAARGPHLRKRIVEAVSSEKRGVPGPAGLTTVADPVVLVVLLSPLQ